MLKCMYVCMSVCMSLCHVFAYFVGKIILAGWENEDENEDGDDDGGKLRKLTTKPMIRLFDFPPNSPSPFLLDIHL